MYILSIVDTIRCWVDTVVFVFNANLRPIIHLMLFFLCSLKLHFMWWMLRYCTFIVTWIREYVKCIKLSCCVLLCVLWVFPSFELLREYWNRYKAMQVKDKTHYNWKQHTPRGKISWMNNYIYPLTILRKKWLASMVIVRYYKFRNRQFQIYKS